jgi:hypothetical protein
MRHGSSAISLVEVNTCMIMVSVMAVVLSQCNQEPLEPKNTFVLILVALMKPYIGMVHALTDAGFLTNIEISSTEHSATINADIVIGITSTTHKIMILISYMMEVAFMAVMAISMIIK